jgi:hypothetical protein
MRTRTLAALALVASLLASARARADEPVRTKPLSAMPDDNATKRMSLEIAGYTDSDHVSVLTPSLSASIDNPTSGASLRGQMLVDVVSAASVDVVSTASRRWTEVRTAGSMVAGYKPGNFGVNVEGSVSSEPDYFAYAAGVTLTHDFDEKNLTLLFGYGFGHDTIGRAHTPFSVFSREMTHGAFTGGFTRVIDRATVLNAALDVVIENGDQSKPYRYVPLFSPTEAANVPKGASIEYVTLHRLPERPLEQLPLARRRFAVMTRLAHRFTASTLRGEERVYYDTWGLKASTTDARWTFDVGDRFSFWPHLRFHIQSPVSFWQRAYVSRSATGWDLPEFRTGNRELGPLWAVTLGGGARLGIGSSASPQSWGIVLRADAIYTSFLDDLYLTARTGFLSALVLEGEL